MKILYVSTISGTINAFLVPHILMLLDQGHKVDIACNITTPISNELLERNCKVFEMELQRSPLSKQNFRACKQLQEIIEKENYDIVHTHTPVASTCVRIACRKFDHLKIIYTAHGFHFFKGAPLKNWLLYYPIEKWLSRYTDTLITINQEDYSRAKKSFKSRKIEYVPGVGLDIDKYKKVDVDQSEIRRDLDIPEEAFVLLSVGELNSNKNHEIVIRAIAKLNNPNIHYIICGKGPLEGKLIKLSEQLGIGNQVKLLGFRRDIIEICKVVDTFIFPSFREGLPVSVMEAMVSELPVICSDIRGIKDLIENNKGGLLVKPNDIEEFARCIEIVIKNEKLRLSMGKYNRESIKKFDINTVNNRIKEIYSFFEGNTQREHVE